MSTLLRNDQELLEKMKRFVQEAPVWGTCAGLILLSKSKEEDERVIQLGVLDIEVIRNYYGRQRESFETKLDLDKMIGFMNNRSIFIRAPSIDQILNENVIVLAKMKYENRDEVVAVRQGNILGTTFHPELIPENDDWHKFFLDMLKDESKD